MSEQTNAPAAADKNKAPILTIKGVPFVAQEVKRNEQKKGVEYPAPSKEFVEGQFKLLAEILAASGKADALTLFNLIPLQAIGRQTYSKLKQNMQNLHEECCEKTTSVHPGTGGTVEEVNWDTFDKEEFEKIVTEGRAATQGETKADLLEEQGELVAEMTSLDPVAESARLMEIISRLRELKEAIAAKSRDRKPKAASVPAPAVEAAA